MQTGDVASFVTYRAADGALTRQAAKALPIPDLSDFAITADGLDLAVSSWQHPPNRGFRVSDLAPDAIFAMPLAAPAVAVAPDGTLAGCGCVARHNMGPSLHRRLDCRSWSVPAASIRAAACECHTRRAKVLRHRHHGFSSTSALR